MVNRILECLQRLIWRFFFSVWIFVSFSFVRATNMHEWQLVIYAWLWIRFRFPWPRPSFWSIRLVNISKYECLLNMLKSWIISLCQRHVFRIASDWYIKNGDLMDLFNERHAIVRYSMLEAMTKATTAAAAKSMAVFVNLNPRLKMG